MGRCRRPLYREALYVPGLRPSLIETFIATIIGLAALFTPTVSYEAHFDRVYADAPQLGEIVHVDYLADRVLTLEERADAIADTHGISREMLRNLVYFESRWDPNAVGDDGCSIGLVQINLCVHKHITESDARNPDFALNFAAQEIAEGREHRWSVCSCWALVKTKIEALPRMAGIQPNWELPEVGAVAIFYYTSKETGKTVKHVAVVTTVEDGGFWIFESNFTPCAVGSRFIKNDDPFLAGFWVQG